MPHSPVLIFTRRLTALQMAIAKLQDGAPSATWEGAVYTAASLPGLYQSAERLGVKAAIEQIENGSQSWSLAGTVYTRGDLAKLWAMDQAYETRAAARARGGIGVRYARLG